MGDIGVSAALVLGILVVAGVSLTPSTGTGEAVVDGGALAALDGSPPPAPESPVATPNAPEVDTRPRAGGDATPGHASAAARGDPADSPDATAQSVLPDHWNLDDDPGYEVNSTDRVLVSQLNGTYRIELVLENGDGWSMTFDRAIAYGEATGRAIFEAIAGADGRVDTAEVVRAIEYWSDGTPVPGTGGETIETPELLELIDHWAAGTVV